MYVLATTDGVRCWRSDQSMGIHGPDATVSASIRCDAGLKVQASTPCYCARVSIFNELVNYSRADAMASGACGRCKKGARLLKVILIYVL